MSINKKYISILSLAIAMLLSACSSGDSEVQTAPADDKPVVDKIQVIAYAPPFASADPTDPSNPTGFYAYTPDKTTNMGVYMLLPDGWASPKEKRITYNTSTSKWNAYFDVTADKTYTIYGYMPKTGEMKSTLAKSTEDAATLTIKDIKPVTTEDICIITGIKGEELKEGQFSWYTPVGHETYFINVLMDHLYAAVQFHMVIDADYALLRTIKLKKMTLSTDNGSVNATISLTHNTTGASPITGVSYEPSNGNDDVVIYSSNEGTALDTTTPLIIDAYFAPILSGTLKMVTTYDVYDRKGNLIRKNCVVRNKIPDLQAVRAQQVQLNLTVNPTYYHVLSDPDLDNPRIKEIE